MINILYVITIACVGILWALDLLEEGKVWGKPFWLYVAFGAVFAPVIMLVKAYTALLELTEKDREINDGN